MLAGLEHPNIARLLDGGQNNGCPYLVIDYVQGSPIHQFCGNLSRDTILKLFLKVGDAVDYAHRKVAGRLRRWRVYPNHWDDRHDAAIRQSGTGAGRDHNYGQRRLFAWVGPL